MKKASTAIPKTIDEYLAGVPEPARTTLSKIRDTIHAAVRSDLTETISYRMPAFKYRGAILVWFAAFANHCSLFPTSATIEDLKDELKGFATSKGTIQFPVDKPLSAALIRKIVKSRMAWIEDKAR